MAVIHQGLLNQRQARLRFDRSAHSYDQHAVVYQEMAERLLSLLDFIKIDPSWILDLGCGTGVLTENLKKRYPAAKLLSVDFSLGMIKAGKVENPVQADALNLPYPDGFVDLVIANALLPWSNDPALIFAEVRRVLKPGGLFLFTTLGPDTLQELRRAWAAIDLYPHVHGFLDMHHLGDALLATLFADPVMDNEYLTIRYKELNHFFEDLKKTGSTNVLAERSLGLLARAKWLAVQEAYLKEDDRFPVTYEFVYGHAWKPLKEATPGEFYFPLSEL